MRNNNFIWGALALSCAALCTAPGVQRGVVNRSTPITRDCQYPPFKDWPLLAQVGANELGPWGWDLRINSSVERAEAILKDPRVDHRNVIISVDPMEHKIARLEATSIAIPRLGCGEDFTQCIRAGDRMADVWCVANMASPPIRFHDYGDVLRYEEGTLTLTIVSHEGRFVKALVAWTPRL